MSRSLNHPVRSGQAYRSPLRSGAGSVPFAPPWRRRHRSRDRARILGVGGHRRKTLVSGGCVPFAADPGEASDPGAVQIIQNMTVTEPGLVRGHCQGIARIGVNGALLRVAGSASRSCASPTQEPERRRPFNEYGPVEGGPEMLSARGGPHVTVRDSGVRGTSPDALPDARAKTVPADSVVTPTCPPMSGVEAGTAKHTSAQREHNRHNRTLQDNIIVTIVQFLNISSCGLLRM